MKTEKDLESALEASVPEVSVEFRQRTLALFEKIEEEPVEMVVVRGNVSRFLRWGLAASLLFGISIWVLIQQASFSSQAKNIPSASKPESFGLVTPGRGYALGDHGQLVRVVRRRATETKEDSVVVVTVF